MIQKWRELSSRKQKNIVLGSLGAIILLMAIGYAAFSTQLNINGTSNISSNWDIRITNIESSLHGGATNAVEPTYDNDNGLTATFSTNLVSPGDYAEYTVTVRNNGDIDATLTNIEITDSNNPAIVFETNGLEEGDNLLKQTEDELIVKVSYNSSITSQPSNTTSDITVTLNYEQATGGSVTPEPETAADQLIVKVTTSGDGLYADAYEEGRYVYKGANPNNYITFSGETWRIISVETDNTIKIMRSESIGSRAFDSQDLRDSGSNGAGGTYCANGDYGCNAWAINDNFNNGVISGTVLKDAELNTYLNGEYLEGLSDADKIVAHNFGVGAVKRSSDNVDLADQITSENGTIWNGKVGLITVSEYLRTNINTEECETLSLYSSNYSTCKNTNWMYASDIAYWWTMSPFSFSTSAAVWYVFSSGNINHISARDSNGVRPSLYLTSNITLSGTGTVDDAYTIN